MLSLQEVGIPDAIVCYADGTGVRLLDVLEVPCLRPVPEGHQRENVLIDTRAPWRKCGSVAWDALTTMVERPERLWASGDSSVRGLNNRVAHEQIEGSAGSLKLIAIPEVTLVVDTRAFQGERPRLSIRARFEYAGERYCLDVTDPAAEAHYGTVGSGVRTLKSVVACVSLAAVFRDGRAYKLMASILTREMLQ